MESTQGANGDREPLPPLMEMALRAIGVVSTRVAPPKALPLPKQGTWYPDGDIPH